MSFLFSSTPPNKLREDQPEAPYFDPIPGPSRNGTPEGGNLVTDPILRGTYGAPIVHPRPGSEGTTTLGGPSFIDSSKTTWGEAPFHDVQSDMKSPRTVAFSIKYASSLFGLIIFFSFIEGMIATWLADHHTRLKNYPSISVRDGTRFLAFTSWGTVLLFFIYWTFDWDSYRHGPIYAFTSVGFHGIL